MIDPRLVTLRLFAECGTVTATAQRSGYSPSAVSAQLRELQKTLGMRLVTKEGRGLRLTSMGRSLVAHTDGLVRQWEAIKADVLGGGEQAPTDFGLGGFSTAAVHLLAPLAGRLRRDRPDARVHVVEAAPGECFELLLAERIDLAVVIAMQAEVHDDPRFEQVPLLDDPLDVLVPSSHPVAGRTSVPLAELAGEDWITAAPGNAYHALFTAAFTAVGLTPRVAHHVVEWETSSALVAQGLGVGLLPRLAVAGNTGEVVRVRLEGASRPVRKIVAVTRRGALPSPLIRDCLDILRQTAGEIVSTRLEEEGAHAVHAGGPSAP